MARIERPLANLVCLTLYLREHFRRVGPVKYKDSLIEMEHGVGTGFGPVGNTGSSDCAKEQIRVLGTSLGYDFETIDKIIFKSSLGNSITKQTRTKKNFRVEHTLEIAKDLWPIYLDQFIFSKHSPTPQEILDWVAGIQIVVGIHPLEQKSKKTHGTSASDYKLNNYHYPFKKYSAPIYYQGQNVSHWTRAQIMQTNVNHHKSLSSSVDWVKFKTDLAETSQKLLVRVKPVQKHLLCPHNIAEKYYNDEFALYHYHYQYKLLEKMAPAPTGGKKNSWYSPAEVAQFRQWEQKNGLQPI